MISSNDADIFSGKIWDNKKNTPFSGRVVALSEYFLTIDTTHFVMPFKANLGGSDDLQSFFI